MLTRLLTLALAVVIAATAQMPCPFLLKPIHASPCGPRSNASEEQCPRSQTAQTCPLYSADLKLTTLEAHGAHGVILPPGILIVPPPFFYTEVVTNLDSRITDSRDAYLQNRVLLL